MKFKGTQGNWNAVLTEHGDSSLKQLSNPNRIMIKSGDIVIAEVNRRLPNKTDYSNAALIEAAPELFARLQQLLSLSDDAPMMYKREVKQLCQRVIDKVLR
jgi:hypothetical protein